jgi:protoheme IX farnesyltransferase
MKTLALPHRGSLAGDLSALVKPRIAVMVLFTVAIGAMLATTGTPDWLQLLHTLVAVLLTASSANTLNQYLERHTDALMHRTENRPLPTGRMSPIEVLVLGLALGVGGIAYQAYFAHQTLAVALNAFTLVSYVAIYTPLKRVTTLNTLVGAVPGALPPLIGWTSVTGRFDAEGVALFLILFLWQVPHFLAIAWMYRDDYARAGLKMLPVVDPEGRATARQMVGYAWTLLLVSLWPVLIGRAGPVYAAGAIAAGLVFLAAAWGFVKDKSRPKARRVMFASLIYLPAVYGLLLVETWLIRS